MTRNLMWFVLCIYFEARGESHKGKIAVGHVIMNRVERRDASIKDIVKAPWQFSWLNPGPTRPKLDDFEALEECINAAIQCMSERLEGKDFYQADHYYAEYIPAPFWASKTKYVGQIDQHLFYRS